MEQELDRIFRLMALLLPHVGLHDAYIGLRSSDELVRANSLELLDNVLDARAAPAARADPRCARSPSTSASRSPTGWWARRWIRPQQAVATLLKSEDAWLRSSAIYAVGALQLRELEAALKRFDDDQDPVLKQSSRRAAAAGGRGGRAVAAASRRPPAWASASAPGKVIRARSGVGCRQRAACVRCGGSAAPAAVPAPATRLPVRRVR